MSRMLRNFIFILFSLTTFTACAQCNIVEGIYRAAGGSEQNTILKLLKNDKFILEHESWNPSEYKQRKVSKNKGTWLCENKNVILKIDDKKFTAIKVTIGKNPLGLDVNTKALHFNAAPAGHYLSNEILYIAD